MEPITFAPEKFDAIAARLTNEDEDARYEAGRQLHRIGIAGAERAIELTRDSRPLMREMACFVLGQIDYQEKQNPDYTTPPEIIATLIHLLETDTNEEVRAAAAVALGHQRNFAALPVLLCMISDPSANVRFELAFALGGYWESFWEKHGTEYKPAVQTALLRLMDDEDEDVRDWATFGIHQGDHNTPEARARLWKALDDPNADVRGEATEGLAKFGDRSLIPRLEKLLREDDDLSPCYFEAAENFGDPTLLPAVLVGAKHWREQTGDDKLHFCIVSAIEALQKAALASSSY